MSLLLLFKTADAPPTPPGTAVSGDFFRLTPNDQADLAELDDDELAVALALLLA